MAKFKISFSDQNGDVEEIFEGEVTGLDADHSFDSSGEVCEAVLALEFEYGTLDFTGEYSDEAGWEYEWSSCEVEPINRQIMVDQIRQSMINEHYNVTPFHKRS